MAKQIKKRNNKGKVAGAVIGLVLVAIVIAGVVCYVKVPAFKEWLSNGWQEFCKLFKKK